MSVQRLPGHEAARRLAGMERLDPRGLCGPGDIEAMCEQGQCFAVAGMVDAVYVLNVRNGVVWVDAIKGSGTIDVTTTLDAIVSEQAKGLNAIACQTPLRGMVRKLERRGFRVTGWILRKELQ